MLENTDIVLRLDFAETTVCLSIWEIPVIPENFEF